MTILGRGAPEAGRIKRHGLAKKKNCPLKCPAKMSPFSVGILPPSFKPLFPLEGVGIPFPPKTAFQDVPESIFWTDPYFVDSPSSSPPRNIQL
jgi:hypothetical protein